jgi:hypothetical protein
MGCGTIGLRSMFTAQALFTDELCFLFNDVCGEMKILMQFDLIISKNTFSSTCVVKF